MNWAVAYSALRGLKRYGSLCLRQGVPIGVLLYHEKELPNVHELAVLEEDLLEVAGYACAEWTVRMAWVLPVVSM